jgi:hypothetical protein
MNASRPIDPAVLTLALAWFGLATVVAAALVSMAARGQRFSVKLLYGVAGLALLSLPASLALTFALLAWYGGRPDPAATVDGHYYVREKARLIEVTANEFRWLQAAHDGNKNWLVWPCVAGGACVGLAGLLRRRTPVSLQEETPHEW